MCSPLIIYAKFTENMKVEAGSHKFSEHLWLDHFFTFLSYSVSNSCTLKEYSDVLSKFNFCRDTHSAYIYDLMLN